MAALIGFLLLPAPAAAQGCWFDIWAFDDLYDNGVDEVEVYGGGWDLSDCPPCGHWGHTLFLTLWGPDGDASDEFAGGEGGLPLLVQTSGTVTYRGDYILWCSCGGPLEMTPLFTRQQSVYRMPTDEYSSFQSWHWDGRGSWAGILLPTGNSFYDRYVREYSVLGSGNDGCRALDPEPIYAPVGLTGGTWNVQASNVYGLDHIGYYSEAIEHYRSIGVTGGPNGCGFTVGQEMRMNRPDLANLMVDYTTNTIGGRITNTTVTSIRDGVEQTRVWP